VQLIWRKAFSSVSEWKVPLVHPFYIDSLLAIGKKVVAKCDAKLEI